MGGRSATWSVCTLRVGIYQYQFQITILWGVDLPLDLPELSEQESISVNFKLPFYGGRSATWSAWAHRVGVYQYQFQITILLGVDLPLDLQELSEQESITANFKLPFYWG